MHDEIDRILEQQQQILGVMGSITRMRRGSLSKQEYAHRRARKDGKGAAGPYFLWQGSIRGKHFSRRVDAQQAAQLVQEIERRHEFERLAAQYIALGERLAEVMAQQGEQEEALKKKPRRRPSKARK